MQRGVIQGNPFSMALFCLAIMPLLKRAIRIMEQNTMESGAPGAVKAYADDWHPIGSPLAGRCVFKYLYANAPKYGLHLAQEKCSWYSLDVNADPPLTFQTGELEPGSPPITLHRTEAFEYSGPEPEDLTGVPNNLANSLSLTAFEALFKMTADAYQKGPRTCGSTRVLGSFIGDPGEILLRLLAKLREFVRELHHLHILHGLTQEQLTLLRESYNARFDHRARSLAPDVLKPAALWYDHFINIALGNIMVETVNYNFSPNGLPPSFEAYDPFLMLLRQKPGDGGTAITSLHSKLHSCLCWGDGKVNGATSQLQPRLARGELAGSWTLCEG